MAEVADIVGVCILPDQRAVLPHDPSWAGLNTVWAVNVVGTLDAVVRPLKQDTEDVTDLFSSFSKIEITSYL